MAGDDVVLSRIAEWARGQEDVRVVLLTSSRAQDGASIDRFSDYDVVLFLSESSTLASDSAWLDAFGRVLVAFQDVVDAEVTGADGNELRESYAMRLVLFEDGTKIDFALASTDLLHRILSLPHLPAMLDAGYRVVLDKDGLIQRLPAPTYTAHIPAPPTQREFGDLVQEFWWETTYVAKQLWRDELLPAKYSLDSVIALDLLRRLLDWHVETEHDWRLRPGDLGRGLKMRLDPLAWKELTTVFAGPALEENWDALFRAIGLFRRVAVDLANRLGLTYPHDLDARVTAYLTSVREAPRTDAPRHPR